MNWLRRKIIDRRQAAKEGRRFHAFYLGYHAFRKGQAANPFAERSEDAENWSKGYQYAQDLAQDPLAGTPLVKLGPGGDYLRTWLEDGT